MISVSHRLSLNFLKFHFRSLMITEDDYAFVIAFDSDDTAAKDKLLKERGHQCAQAFFNLLGHVSKDQTIQYILIMIDDMLQVIHIKL